MEIIFSHPEYLWALFVVPIVVLFHFFNLSARKRRALQFGNFEAIARVRGVEIYSRNLTTLIITVLSLVALVGALAEPSLVRELSSSKSSFVIAIDVSRSMEATDILPTRLDAAKSTAHDFIETLPSGTRLGIVSFSGNSYIIHPVSSERSSVLHALDSVSINPLGGTDFAEAITTATNILEDEEYKAIILLSDGQSNIGDLDAALTYARQHAVVIYAIGLGTAEGGKTSYGFSKVDEDSLKAIAYETFGEFYRAIDANALATSFKNIEEIKTGPVSQDATPFFLIAALLLFLLAYFISTGHYPLFP